MNEIIKVLNENRKRWEYYFSGYYKKLPIDKDDIFNDVVIKIIDAYNNNQIKMDNLTNYSFITYRNYIYQLYKDNKKNMVDNIDDCNIIDEIPSYEFFEPKSKLRLQIEEIIGEDAYNELLLYYEYKSSKNKKKDNFNPYTNRPFEERDKVRYYHWRKKIKNYLHLN